MLGAPVGECDLALGNFPTMRHFPSLLSKKWVLPGRKVWGRGLGPSLSPCQLASRKSPSPALHVHGLRGRLCFLASCTATWRMSRSRCSCSSGRRTTACCGPMPSTRSTALQARPCPPAARRPSTLTPKSWRSRCCRRTACVPCKQGQVGS